MSLLIHNHAINISEKFNSIVIHYYVNHYKINFLTIFYQFLDFISLQLLHQTQKFYCLFYLLVNFLC
jgi:hypothetical protein